MVVYTAVFTARTRPCTRPCSWHVDGRCRIHGRVHCPCTRLVHGRVHDCTAVYKCRFHGRVRAVYTCRRPCTGYEHGRVGGPFMAVYAVRCHGCVRPTGARTESAFRKSQKICRMNVLCMWVKLQHICKVWAVNCTKMCLVAGLRPEPLGELQRSLRLPGRY